MKTQLSSINVIKDEVGEIKTSQEFIARKFDELNAKLSTITVKNTRRIRQLESIVEELEEEIDILTERQYDQERRSRLDNLEFHNIPYSRDEDCEKLIMKVAARINVPLQSSDISNCHRMSKENNKKPSPIIVKFVRRKTRHQILKNRRQLRSANFHEDFQHFTRSTRIFIIENLNDNNKDLFFKARDLKKECGYKYLWTHNGKVLIKKNEMTTTIPINNEDDLSLIK
ncbi:uncharacterized protein LOC144419957 [Styela clava]